MPFIFEPGRESLFKFTLLSDDRDDDGEPDFFFEDIKPELDWKRSTALDAWHKGGEGNQLVKYNLGYQGVKPTAGGPLTAATWTRNSQYQLTLSRPTRVFVFVEARNVKTDMRDVEGLQPEPAYPSIGFVVAKGRGDHVLLDKEEAPSVLHTAPCKKGDGVYLELGTLPPLADKYVLLPYTEEAGVEHEFAITLYTDYDVELEKIDPTRVLQGCLCDDTAAIAKVAEALKRLEAKYALVEERERELKRRGAFGIPKSERPSPPPTASQPPPSAPVASEFGAGIGGPGFGGAAPYAAARPALTAPPPAPPTERNSLFDRVDTNRDGQISAMELKRATVELQMREEAERAVQQAQAQEKAHQLREANAELRELQAQLQGAKAARAGSKVEAVAALRGSRQPKGRRGPEF